MDEMDFYADVDLDEFRRMTPGQPNECGARFEGCDECDYYLECFPDWSEHKYDLPEM